MSIRTLDVALPALRASTHAPGSNEAPVIMPPIKARDFNFTSASEAV